MILSYASFHFRTLIQRHKEMYKILSIKFSESIEICYLAQPSGHTSMRRQSTKRYIEVNILNKTHYTTIQYLVLVIISSIWIIWCNCIYSLYFFGSLESITSLVNLLFVTLYLLIERQKHFYYNCKFQKVKYSLFL